MRMQDKSGPKDEPPSTDPSSLRYHPDSFGAGLVPGTTSSYSAPLQSQSGAVGGQAAAPGVWLAVLCISRMWRATCMTKILTQACGFHACSTTKRPMVRSL